MSDNLYLVRVASMLLPSVANLREHWAKRAKRVKAQRAATALALIAYACEGAQTKGSLWQVRNLLRCGEKLHVKLIRVAPRPLDTDNLAGALKAVRDEVAKQLVVNDDPKSAVTWEVDQMKPMKPKAKPGVMILIGAARTS